MTDPSFYYAIFKKFQSVSGGNPAPGFGHVNDDNSNDLDGGFSLLHTQDQYGLYGHLGPHAEYVIDNLLMFVRGVTQLIPGAFTDTVRPTFNEPLWSLPYELWLYAVLALMVAIGGARSLSPVDATGANAFERAGLAEVPTAIPGGPYVTRSGIPVYLVGNASNPEGTAMALRSMRFTKLV